MLQLQLLLSSYDHTGEGVGRLRIALFTTLSFCTALSTFPCTSADHECVEDVASVAAVTTSCFKDFTSYSTGSYAKDCSTGRTQEFMECLAFSGNCNVQRELISLVSTALTAFYRCKGVGASDNYQQKSVAAQLQVRHKGGSRGRRAHDTGGMPGCYLFCKIGKLPFQQIR